MSIVHFQMQAGCDGHCGEKWKILEEIPRFHRLILYVISDYSFSDERLANYDDFD